MKFSDRRWQLIPADDDLVNEISRQLGLPLPIARILVSRGFHDVSSVDKHLRKSITDLVSPFELDGMKNASERLAEAVRENQKILIHGDFDADGITSAAMLSLFLKELGADVIPFVPNRLVEGHGISRTAIEISKEQKVDLLITCDCGTSSHKEIEELVAYGIDTIISDHHTVAEGFPAGAILVNPKNSSDSSAHADLSGVGVAYILAIATRSTLRDLGYFESRPEPNLKAYLDIVALGTLADMAALRGQNRILVQHGLHQILMSRRPGIMAMKENAKLVDVSSILSDDVGFRLAPRINAAARLGHASEAMELLMTSDYSRAQKLAQSLETWNEERKVRLNQMMRIAGTDALTQVEAGRGAIVVSSDHFHSGIIGLVAQKLASEHHRPAIVFAIEGKIAKGSARSRGGHDLMEAFERCSHLVDGFGGHKEAGGCSLPLKNLATFKKCFVEFFEMKQIAAMQEILIDAQLNLRHLNEEIVSALGALGPFGMGNPEPIFQSGAKAVGVPKQVGRGHLKLSLTDLNGVGVFSGIGFDLWQSAQSPWNGSLSVAYTPEVNVWKGTRQIQVRLKAIRTVQGVDNLPV